MTKLLIVVPSSPPKDRHRTIYEKSSAFFDSLPGANPSLQITVLRDFHDYSPYSGDEELNHQYPAIAKKSVIHPIYQFPFDYFLFIDPEILSGPDTLPSQLVDVSAKEAIVGALAITESKKLLYDPRDNYIKLGHSESARSIREFDGNIIHPMESVGYVVLVPRQFMTESFFPIPETPEGGEWPGFCNDAKSEGAKVLLYKPPVCTFASVERY